MTTMTQPTPTSAAPELSAGQGAGARGTSRRERVRASTVAEIKAAALNLMSETGSTQVHFSDIAKSMGMTAPGLYRYFADRDALLTELIRDAYNDLADHLERASGSVPQADLWKRLLKGMQTYRAWALAQPQRFALIFGLPIPGLEVSEESGTTEAAARAMAVLENIVIDAVAADRLQPSILTQVGPALCSMANDKHELEGVDLPAAAYQGVIQAWIGVHGFVSLESSGHLDWQSPDVRDELFLAQVELSAHAIGIARG